MTRSLRAPGRAGPSERAPRAAARAERLFLWLTAALAIATALRMPAAWESGNALNHVSGAWMTLADDLARGTLYRPLHDGAGLYGGTRFFPLVFALHAGLAEAGLGLVAAGYALSAAAGGALVLGAFVFLRRLGLSRAPALAFGALALAGFAAQHGLSSARGDLLPVALSALGLAALLPAPTPRRILASALLLALAFAAKPTALTAAGAAVAFLVLRRARAAAAALAVATAALGAAAVLATDALSGGRFLAVLRASATGGGDLGHALRAPLRLAHQLAVADPPGLVLLAGAALALGAAATARARGARATEPAAAPLLLPALWLAAAAAGAVVVFASPGTGANHLVEGEVAAALVLAAAARARGGAARVARAVAPIAAAAGIVLAAATWRADAEGSRLAEIRAVAAALPPGRVVSEDPLVPLLAGARPVLLDPWMLRVAAAGEPALTDGLRRGLAGGDYAAVILLEDLGAPGADGRYAAGNLGLPLVRAIRRGYRQAAAIGRYHLYLPATPGDVADEAQAAASGGRASVVAAPPAR
jgi:hypothetical protein